MTEQVEQELSVDELKLVVQHYQQELAQKEERIALLRVQVTVAQNFLTQERNKVAQYEAAQQAQTGPEPTVVPGEVVSAPPVG